MAMQRRHGAQGRLILSASLHVVLELGPVLLRLGQLRRDLLDSLNRRLPDLMAELVIRCLSVDAARDLALLDTVAGLTIQDGLVQAVCVTVGAVRLALSEAIVASHVVRPDAATGVSERIMM